jgi:hypothetical protein
MKTLGFVYVVFWLAVIGGWIANVVKFIGLLGGEVNGWFVARLVGIVAVPLGAVLGYL